MKTSRLLAVAALGAIAALNLVLLWGQEDRGVAMPLALPERDRVVAAGPGRVEPISGEIAVAAQVSGQLSRILVEEGDHVERGELLAVLDNGDHLARVHAAEAEAQLKGVQWRRVMSGARDQERREAAAAVAEADVLLGHARSEWLRRQVLLGDGVISSMEAEAAERDALVAEARLDAARERLSLIEAGPRDEVRQEAGLELAGAEARLREARALYEKTFLRAPIGGIVVRRHREVGETVSLQPPSPVVTIADRTVLRVRVDIDEVDVARVVVGQRAYVTADAFDGHKFWGRVVRVGQLLGRATVRTDEPSERVDTKVLEVLIDLDDAGTMPLGLRVQAFVLGDP